MSGGDIRVLHVDDEPELAAATGRVLAMETDDIVVEPATSVSEALDLLADEEFDCLVSDYDMPEMNGLSFLEHVHEAHPELPFILFTGKGSEEVASEAIGRGVTDYLQKGSGTDQYAVLANRIRNAVSDYRARREAATTRRRFETLLDRYRFETLATHGFEVQFILDGTGECSYAGQSVEPLLGYAPEELIGENFLDHVHPDDRERARETLDAAVDGTEDPAGQFRVTTADDETVVLEARARDRRDDPAVRGVVLVGRDVTERARHRRRADALADRLDAIAATVEGTLRPAATAAREAAADGEAVAAALDRLDDGLAEIRSLAAEQPVPDDGPDDPD